MVQVTRSYPVDKPLATVVGYLRDFSTAEAWDPGTTSCTRQDSGEIAVGSRWHNVSQFRGREVELDYELQRMDDDRLTFVGRNSSATSTDDLRFAPNGTGTSITYQATIELKGLMKLAAPLLQRTFEKLADEVVEKMTRALEGLPD